MPSSNIKTIKAAIIPCSPPSNLEKNWQKLLANAITDPAQLLKQLNLSKQYLAGALKACQQFPLRVPQYYVDLMDKNNINDPLLKQILPLDLEMEAIEGFSQDPTGDLNAKVSQGILDKYQGRGLIISTGACAVHCRYCFRRHFPYQNENAGAKQWQQTIEYLTTATDLNEIILSGGDPLCLSNQRLVFLLDELDKIPHIKRIRWHSRFPVVLPYRLDQGLIDLIQQSRFKHIFVLHLNHPKEITSVLKKRLRPLVKLNVLLLNQAVLLKGINDQSEILAKLSEACFDADILPYYLHKLDKVAGAAHFEVSDKKARKIILQLRNQLSGYLVPRYVEEVAGEKSKQWL